MDKNADACRKMPRDIRDHNPHIVREQTRYVGFRSPDKSSRCWIYAQINNFSEEGMYFETDVALKPGTKLIIKFDQPIFPKESERLTSIVQWCKELADDRGTISSFGLGVEFIKPYAFTR